MVYQLYPPISQIVGSNDGWRLYGESPASNDVKVIFEVVDDIETGDTWVFRNKKTYSPWTATEPFKISGEGNVTALGTVSATGGNSTNWNTAYGWGNHASAGYYSASNPNGYTNDQTAAEILTAIKTVDGSGSGLDADLLDGQHASAFLTTSGTAANSQLLDSLDSTKFTYYRGIVSGDWDTIFTTASNQLGTSGLYQVQNLASGHSNHPTGVYTYGGVFAWQLANSTFKLYSSHLGDLSFQSGWGNDEYSGWRRILTSSYYGDAWTSSNDGAGSGLDADLLDGQQGSHYLAWANVTGKPTIPTNNNQLTNGSGYQTTSGSVAQSHYVSGNSFATTSSPGNVLEYQQASGITDTKLAPSSDWHNTIRMGHGNPYSYYSSTIAMQMTGTGYGQIKTQSIQNNNAAGWRTQWDSANDGSGSGLDADLLDGQQGSYYLAYGNLTGSPTIPTIPSNNVVEGGTSYSGEYPMVARTSANTIYSHNGIKFNGAQNKLTVAGSVVINGGTSWHSGNDGSGSGLDADLLDGYQKADINPAHSHYRWTGIAASGVQARRFVIMRLYACPAHWDSNWQDIHLKVWSETYEATNLKYEICGDYNGGNQNTMFQLRLKDAGGSSEHGRFRLVLGTPVDAGWDHSGQNTYYVDVYAEVSHYMNFTVAADFYSAGFNVNTLPTSGGATSVVYSSPTVSNITTFNEAKEHSYFANHKIWNDGNHGSASGLDADLLDGQHGSYYAPASSIPTVNNGTLSITTSGSVSGGGSFTANNSGNVTLNLTGNGIMQGTNAVANSSFSDAIGAGFRFQRITGGTNRAYGSHHNLLQIPNTSGDQYLAQMAFGTGDTKLAWRGKNTSFGSWFDIWHSGNDGSGSGLDADLLDGQQGSYYAPASHNHSGVYLPISGKAADSELLDGIDSTGFVKQLADGTSPNYQTPSSRRVDPTTSNPTNAHHAISTFGNGGNVTGQLATHFVSGQAYTRGYNSSWSAWRKQWDSLNDGSGSGLDADLLDGQHGSYYYSAANPPPTYSKYLRSDTSDTMSGTLSLHGNLLLTGTATTTNQGRMIDFTGFDKEGTTDPSDRAYIAHTINTGGHAGSVLVISSQNDSNDGIAFATHGSSQLKHNSNTIWTAGNDGSGSGLDADLLDGQHASAFLTTETNAFIGNYGSATTHPGTNRGIYSGQLSQGTAAVGMPTSDNSNSILTFNRHSGDYNSQLGFSSNSNMYYRSFSNVAINSTHTWRKVWDSGNDGSGSGLDADFLDGQQGSYYLPTTGKAADSNLLDGIDSVRMVHGSGGARTDGSSNVSPTTSATWMPSGFYENSNGSGTPSSQWYNLIQMRHTNTGNNHGHQIAGSFYDNNLWNRNINNNSYGAWSKSWSQNNDGSGSGLDADLLDGQHGSYYAPASHVHSYLPLSGGTLTGNVLFANSGTTKRGIQGQTGSNDYWFVGGGATASNSGYMEISAGDDGTTAGSYEPIYVRQYLGTPLTGTVQRTLTLLDNNGNTAIPNALTVGGDLTMPSKIIHSGDTNTYMQFHAADQWRVVTGGAERLEVNNSYVTVAPTLSVANKIMHTGDTDTYMSFDAADQWKLYCGGYKMIQATEASTGYDYISFGGTDNSGEILFNVNGGDGHFDGNVYAYSTTTSSDRKLKKNIQPLEGALEKVQNLRGVSFEWKKDDKKSIGFIAQEVQEVVPDLVKLNRKEHDGVLVSEHLGVDYGNITALLVEAMKEQQETINKLEARILTLEKGEK